MARRACAIASIFGSKKRQVPRPSRLARYNARSAFFSNCVGCVASPGASAMPMLTPTTTRCPCNSYGAPTVRTMRRAKVVASVGSETPSCRMANSSPPSRATVSLSRTTSRSRNATSRSNSSPIGWPSVSFTALNWSTSRYSSANPSVRSRGPAPAPAAPGTVRDSATGSAGRVAPGKQSAPPTGDAP